MPFTPFNWYIRVLLLLLCQTSAGTTFLLNTLSDPPNFNPSVDYNKWWPLLPWSPTQNKAMLCPEMPEAYLRFEFNSLRYCTSFHLKLWDRAICLCIYFWDRKYYWFPWHGCVFTHWDYTEKEPSWTESERQSCTSAWWRAELSLSRLLPPPCSELLSCSPSAGWWGSIYCWHKNIRMDYEHTKLQ